MKGLYKIGKPEIETSSINRKFNKHQKFKRSNFYFLMGILTAVVFFVILMNLVVFDMNS